MYALCVCVCVFCICGESKIAVYCTPYNITTLLVLSLQAEQAGQVKMLVHWWKKTAYLTEKHFYTRTFIPEIMEKYT